ncbi:hypothetical protein PENTCL1PPCAC_17289, partial [Pristionchus entomophagus]
MGSFIYRLLLLKEFENRLSFSSIFSWMIAYTALSSLIWFIIGSFACVLDKETRLVLGNFLSGSLPNPIIHTPVNIDNYVIALYWVDCSMFRTTFEKGRWEVIGYITAVLSLFFVDYCVMVYCTVHIIKLFDTHNSMSKFTMQLQRKLLRSLIGQMIFPLFTIYNAAFVSMALPIIGSYAFPIVAVFMPNLCELNALADGTVLMVTVTQYRRDIIEILE